MIKVIAFDLFGTVFDPASADPDDKEKYIKALRAWRQDGTYCQIHWLDSFEVLQPYHDSVEGLRKLTQEGYKIVAASNIPEHHVRSSSRFAGIEWDAILELGKYRIYKPDLAAYAAICDLMKCSPSEVLMVTGNHGKYGIGDDIEPLKIGMRTAKIRRDSPIQTIVQLAEQLTSGQQT